MQRLKKQLPFWAIVIAVMALAIGVSVATTVVLIHRDTVAENKQTIQRRILRVARSTAKMPAVKRVIRASNAGADTNLQTVIKPLVSRDDVDFIVVMNHQLIRLSHPRAKSVGHHFSSVKDPTPALRGQIHYSQKPGVLGPEYRVFLPVHDRGRVIGVVCVGLTQQNLDQQLQHKTRPILLGGLLGFLIGCILAILLGMYLRYLLLGMEPSEISERIARQKLIDDSLPEGIVAINRNGSIISANQTAQHLFGQPLSLNAPLPATLRALLFAPATRQTSGSEVAFQDKRLLVTTNDLRVRGRVIGQVSLIRDMSAITGLIDKLAGTEHYISSLRAQTHEFMNQLQVINGLLELAEYPRALQFMQEITNSYHQDVGAVTDKIKWPAMVGLILGKRKEAKEQGLSLTIDAQSAVTQVTFENRVEVLALRIVSNLLDNAIAAIKAPKPTDQVTLRLALTATGTLTIVVTDTGSGISPAVRTQMFTQGFSTKGPQRGYGMSLIMAAVTTLKGTLAITANSPQGTVVTIQVETGAPK